jgi:hypothetical protein
MLWEMIRAFVTHVSVFKLHCERRTVFLQLIRVLWHRVRAIKEEENMFIGCLVLSISPHSSSCITNHHVFLTSYPTAFVLRHPKTHPWNQTEFHGSVHKGGIWRPITPRDCTNLGLLASTQRSWCTEACLIEICLQFPTIPRTYEVGFRGFVEHMQLQ